jgi:hypothetical protein
LNLTGKKLKAENQDKLEENYDLNSDLFLNGWNFNYNFLLNAFLNNKF